jgi:hypothetical protein
MNPLLLQYQTSSACYRYLFSEFILENKRASIEVFLKAAGHLECAMQHVLPRMSTEKRWSTYLPPHLGMTNNAPSFHLFSVLVHD